MSRKEIPDNAIEKIAKHINERNSKPSKTSIVTIDGETETPHYFEIVSFNQIDQSSSKFFAIDGSYNSQEFYNGLSIGIYTAGYVCYTEGKQIRLNKLDDPVILGKSYYPENILVTNEEHRDAIYDELLSMEPVRNMLKYFEADEEAVFGFPREVICMSLPKLLSFCQEVLEWALVYEIAMINDIGQGDYILRDGTLRSNNIKQKYLIKIAEHLKSKGIHFLAITKNSPIKLELSSTFKKIDSFLQEEYKPKYPFKTTNPRWQKICCWFEVSDDILIASYPEAGQRKNRKEGGAELVTKSSMFAKKGLTGGRGAGIFFAARLDYVEKLQNYDWVIVDLNIFDVIPEIKKGIVERDINTIKNIFLDLTRLTQEHYILGYPFPLVEVHNFVTLKNDFKEEIIKRVKYSLYRDQRMDNVDIENIFLDIHERF